MLAILMAELTLLAKVKSNKQLRQVDESLKLALEGLKVDFRVLGKVADRWPHLALTGDDEAVATNYILKEIGVCPTTIENLRESSTLKGFLTNLKNNTDELRIDVGVFEPEIVTATVSLRHLQVQLVKGMKVSLERIASIFGFCEDLPINIKIFRPNKDENSLKAELSEKQVAVYHDWQQSLLDRLIILGPTLPEIQQMFRRLKLRRDVINMKPLGIFEHVLTCKFGTDAVGLISRIGIMLRNARFAVFNPRKISI